MAMPFHQLFPLEGTDRSSCSSDVVFFHGLQIKGGGEAWESTWVSPKAGTDGKDVCWIREWLPQDFDKIRILSASYDSDATMMFGRGNTKNTEDIGDMLARCMKHYGIGERKFVLVGHSLGGLVIKNLVVEMHRLSHMAGESAIDRALRTTCKSFLNNLEGIVFYAVPHTGADATSLVSFLKPVLSSIMKDLKPFQKRMEKLSVMTVDAFGDKKVNIMAFAEGRPTHGKIIVTEASAMPLSKNHYFKLEDCNHMEVCKPPSKDHASYFHLKDFLEIVLEVEPTRAEQSASAAEARRQATLASPNNSSSSNSVVRQFLPTPESSPTWMPQSAGHKISKMVAHLKELSPYSSWNVITMRTNCHLRYGAAEPPGQVDVQV